MIMKKVYASAVLALFLSCSGGDETKIQKPEFAVYDVFVAGQEGYQSFRIPSAMETADGGLIAFCEGRKNGVSDTGDIDLVMKTSSDGGITWGPLSVVVDFGANTAGNPAPFLEKDTGRLWLPFTSNPGEDTEAEIIEGASSGTREVHLTWSDDSGETWAAPLNITSQVKKANWTWYATGPGRSIQLQSGRFLVPCNHHESGGEMHSHVIYSDDRGKTWKTGGILPGKTDESQVAELDDGTLIINMRNRFPDMLRAVARSTDEGLSWSEITLDPALIGPACQGSLINTEYGLLFSNPASDSSVLRENLTVRLSEDEGETWAFSRVIHEGASAYSALCVIPEKGPGCLFENGENLNPYEKISFAVFNKAWIKQ